MTFTPRQGSRYDMPVAFGPSIAPAVEKGFETYTTSITYRSSAEAIGELLPEWFVPAEDQMVSAVYTRMINMEWMGGRNYNIASVRVNVVCVCTPKPIPGSYTLAIWESDCAPILAGREYMGSPKLFGVIPDVDIFAGEFSFRCSEYDAPLLDGTASRMREMTAEELAKAKEAGRSPESFNWKYIPGYADEPDISYPTALYMSHDYDRGMRGHGIFSFGTPTDTEAPYSAKIVRTLAKIPLLEHVDTVSLHSAYSYLFRDRTRRLDVLAAD
jgi:acetoacetate decarboxylase